MNHCQASKGRIFSCLPACTLTLTHTHTQAFSPLLPLVHTEHSQHENRSIYRLLDIQYVMDQTMGHLIHLRRSGSKLFSIFDQFNHVNISVFYKNMLGLCLNTTIPQSNLATKHNEVAMRQYYNQESDFSYSF